MVLSKLTINELRIYNQIVGLMTELTELTGPQMNLKHCRHDIEFKIMWNMDSLDQMRERYEIDKLDSLGWKDVKAAYMEAKKQYVRHCSHCGVTPYTMTSKSPRFWVTVDLCSECAALQELTLKKEMAIN